MTMYNKIVLKILASLASDYSSPGKPIPSIELDTNADTRITQSRVLTGAGILAAHAVAIPATTALAAIVVNRSTTSSCSIGYKSLGFSAAGSKLLANPSPGCMAYLPNLDPSGVIALYHTTGSGETQCPVDLYMIGV